MLTSAYHPQFKLSWLKYSLKIEVNTERIIKLVNEKERLHADGNKHIAIEEEDRRAAIFILL